MDVSDQLEEIIVSNGARISAMFREAAGRVKIYKRVMNIWTCDLVEERALEALLQHALREHLETRAEQTVATQEFYAISVRGRPSEGIEIQVMHPLAAKQVLTESFAPAQSMVDSAFGDGRA